MNKGWNHGYLGLALLALGIWLGSWWFLVPGIILVVDEISQIIMKDQYGGLLHWIYVNTLYKIPLIQKFNIWLDGLFGKDK